MRDITQIYGHVVLKLIFPKELSISAMVCDESALAILRRLKWSLLTPCNPYVEVIRGMVRLDTEERMASTDITKRDEDGLRFLEINYINRRVTYGMGPTLLDRNSWSFKGILTEIHAA